MMLSTSSKLFTPSRNRRTPVSTMQPSTRKRVEDSSRSPSPNFGLRYHSLREGILRNLIAVCFLISVALASCKCGGHCNQPLKTWKLTTQKSGTRTNVVGAVVNLTSMWKDTSTIEVSYHSNRDYKNWCNNNHKYKKVKYDFLHTSISDKLDLGEWFTITHMIQHDKANNRIEVQIYGMKNRWIYYLEHDGLDFIEHLRTEKDTVNLGHKWRWGWWALPKVQHGQVKGLPTQKELTRGDADKGIYGFRVAFQKEGSVLGKLDDTVFGAAKNNWSSWREFFDAVSVRVHLKGHCETEKTGLGHLRDMSQILKCKCERTWILDNTVDYIEIPNAFRNVQAVITKIDLFDSNRKTVILGLVDRPNYKKLNFMDFASNRKLFLGGEETIGMEGKKLLRFLIDHAGAGDYADDITDDSRFTKFVAGIDGDWDARPTRHEIRPAGNTYSGLHQYQGRRLADRLASDEANCEPIRC